MKRCFPSLIKLLVVIFLLAAANPSYAQITSSGNDFWFNFMHQHETSGRTYDLKIFISSETNASGTVSVPGRSWSQNFTVSANSTNVITVPTNVGHVTIADAISDQGIHITSDNNINVFALNYSINTTDGSLILPVDAIGNDYYILTYTPLANEKSGFSIVAVENNTQVRIIPSQATTGGHAAGVPYNITIDQGQVYQVESTGDLTGSRVYSIGSKKKIAVFGGATCVNIPPGNTACDHLFEQMFPNNTLRRNFVAIPYKTRTKGDTYRVLATKNGTTVTFNGGSPLNLNAGQWSELTLGTATYISSNYPVSIGQYSNGSAYDGVTASDPFFIMLSPVEQTREDITFEVFNFVNITGNYLNIAAKTSCTSNIRLDGTTVTGWQVVSGKPTYSYVQLSVSQGPHRLVSAKDCGFNAYVYGYGTADSYGYSAGVRLDTLAIDLTANTDCAGSGTEFFVSSYPYPIVNYNWKFGDGGTSTEERPVHVYQNGGTYTVTLIVTYDNSEKDTIVQKFTITEPQADFTYTGGQCGNRTVIFNNTSTVIGGTISIWDWDFGDGQTSNAKSPTHTYASYGTYRVILTVTTRNGCEDADTINVKVTPPVTTNAPDNYEICFGSSRQIGGDILTGSGGYSFKWTPVTDLSSPVVQKPIASPKKTTRYYVTIVDNEGCSHIDTIDVIVNPLPIVELGDDVESCLYVPIQIGSFADSGTAPYYYRWTPTTGLNIDTLPRVMASPPQTTTYTVVITDSKGCVTTDSITVNILPLPEPRIVPEGPIDICSCDSILLDAGSGFIQYNWSNGDSTQTTIIKDAGDYTVTVTDTNGCVNESPSVRVNIIYPSATITLGTPSYTVEPGQTIKIPVYISQSEYLDFCNSRNYILDLSFNKFIMVPAGNTPIGIFDNNLRRIQITGTRDSNSDTLTVLSFMGTLGDVVNSPITIENFTWTDCDFDTRAINSDVTLTGLCAEGGVTRLYKSPQTIVNMIISPNPVTGETNIEYSLAKETAVKIFVTDISAAMNFTLFEGIKKKGAYDIKFDASHLANGSYLVVIQTPDEAISTILEVQR